MKGKLGSGKELEQTMLFLPNAYPQSGGKLPISRAGTTPQPSPAANPERSAAQHIWRHRQRPAATLTNS